ncbi:hypothetical protein APHNP_0390 [Anaplasma phagocytophilum str. ApNP]|uniref:Uncharacterized protein n=2 Tax=Anaplasma phagocytophilum TaxID=948 RepID=A0A0F3NIG1_ANAPH|nr:hypothetical protein APHMUC_0593 [Anaplasma phagocytophilum str. ApMUC09]KJV67848.1 hypothetical protein APHNP_0390 [Anaplasma phagocytophilum str. ApNP]
MARKQANKIPDEKNLPPVSDQQEDILSHYIETQKNTEQKRSNQAYAHRFLILSLYHLQ